ncbi:MAG: Sapep family Mn(2+)-dependent dipeptidase [Thermaerobacter sp.]|nr:Sapep family Mn(2+)-dependent dipeptidase [Thermaerobacter sp.]
MDWQISSEDIVQVARSLIRVRSIREAPQPGAPFGMGVRQAFDAFRQEAEGLGLHKIRDYDGYAIEAEIGQGDEILGVLVHLDTVAEGDGWTVSPLAGIVEHGRLFGRGALDDKGPAAAALCALSAVARLGPPLHRRVRLIAGGDEESYWQCMDHYLKTAEHPTLGFTPDSDFPLIHGEKGGLTLRLERDPRGPQRYLLEAGSQPNVVPDRARLELAQPVPTALATERALELGVQMVPDDTDPRRVFEVLGQGAHASVPHLGTNAVREAVRLFQDQLSDPLLELLAADSDGTALGIAHEEPDLGRLTINLGVVRHDAAGTRIWLDVRYPRGLTGEEIASRLAQRLQPFGVRVVTEFDAPVHWVAKDDPLVQRLLGVYRAHTGDDSPPLTMGGLTYARTLGRAVAFGPAFPGRPEVAHQADEHVFVEDLLRAARIYADAIVELAAD